MVSLARWTDACRECGHGWAYHSLRGEGCLHWHDVRQVGCTCRRRLPWRLNRARLREIVGALRDAARVLPVTDPPEPDDLFDAPVGEETMHAAFARLSIGPGEHVTAEQYPQLPAWFRARLERHGLARPRTRIIRRETR